MNGEQLRELQAPVKTRYRENAESAKLTLHAKGRVSQETLTCTIESGKPGAPVGLHPAAGGDGTKACSAEVLLEALVGCAGVTLAAVSTSMGFVLKSATIAADGELDFRGTLGVDKSAPVGFTKIRLTFTIDTDAPSEKLHKLIELTERYCVVAQTIKSAVPIESRLAGA